MTWWELGKKVDPKAREQLRWRPGGQLLEEAVRPFTVRLWGEVSAIKPGFSMEKITIKMVGLKWKIMESLSMLWMMTNIILMSLTSS